VGVGGGVICAIDMLHVSLANVESLYRLTLVKRHLRMLKRARACK
jgi:hypothetical protein